MLAVVLVATGLYGTLAYRVNMRTAEIGVRMAVGAQRGQVVWMILKDSLLLTRWGGGGGSAGDDGGEGADFVAVWGEAAGCAELCAGGGWGGGGCAGGECGAGEAGG